MKTCTRPHCVYPDCDCQIDRISGHRRTQSVKYRLALRKLLIDEIRKVAAQRGTTDKRIATQLGFTPQAYSRLIHKEGGFTSVDSLLLYLARLGVGVTLHFEDLSHLPIIETGNPHAHKTGEQSPRSLSA